MLVLATLVPATIVIPVLRAFVSASQPNREWVIHAFMAVNLLGACVVGPVLAVRADRLARRRLFAGALAVLDGLMLIGVALQPPVALMLALRFVQGAASVGAVSILMGSARGRATSSAAIGLVGSSVVLAIVIGIPLGAILGRSDPALPLYVGGAIGVIAGLIALIALPAANDAEASPVPMRALLTEHFKLRAPATVVGLERMAVGAFVVTLQLYGHHVLEVPDTTVSAWFTAFLVTFALATVPMTRLSDRVDRWKVVSAGAAVYGAAFIALGLVPGAFITPLLMLGGLASAAIYGPALTLASQAVPASARASAMAVMNASGTLGMFLGNVAGFALAAALVESGVSRETAYTVVFAAAGAAQGASVIIGVSANSRAEALVSTL